MRTEQVVFVRGVDWMDNPLPLWVSPGLHEALEKLGSILLDGVSTAMETLTKDMAPGLYIATCHCAEEPEDPQQAGAPHGVKDVRRPTPDEWRFIAAGASPLIKLPRCPGCSEPCTGLVMTDGSSARPPRAGDVAVCLACACLIFYTGPESSRLMSAEDRAQRGPEQMAPIEAEQAEVLRHKAALRIFELNDGGEDHHIAAESLPEALRYALDNDLISDEPDELNISAVSDERAAKMTVDRRDDGLPPSTLLEELKTTTKTCLLASSVY